MNLVTVFCMKPVFADASPRDCLGDLQTLIWDTQSLGRGVLASVLFLTQFIALRDETDKHL